VPVRYVGFDIPNEFVVGYGLDYAERYRNLPFVGTLAPHVYTRWTARRPPRWAVAGLASRRSCGSQRPVYRRRPDLAGGSGTSVSTEITQSGPHGTPSSPRNLSLSGGTGRTRPASMDVKRYFRGPIFWVILAILAVLTISQVVSSTGGFKKVDTASPRRHPHATRSTRPASSTVTSASS
jgi:hypothetical protein